MCWWMNEKYVFVFISIQVKQFLKEKYAQFFVKENYAKFLLLISKGNSYK